MYFLSEEERRLLAGKLLPLARQHEVHAELRGWSWREPPLAPPYDVPLGVYEIAAKYCPTSRDVYLRRVLDLPAKQNRAMRDGAALHAVVRETVLRAKQIIYHTGTAGCLDELERLADWAGEAPSGGDDEEVAERGHWMKALRLFEQRRIVGRVQETMSRQPRAGVDSLVALALPVIVERQLDGSLLGLSPHLSTDAVATFEPVVFDLKLDRRRDFHRLATAAYAVVVESLHEHPVDIGCVVYARVEGERVTVERDLHLIDDELRQWLIDERDERMRMVSEEIDPGKPDQCAADCPYLAACRRG